MATAFELSAGSIHRIFTNRCSNEFQSEFGEKRTVLSYEISYVRRGYERKSKAEKDAYRQAISQWKATGMQRSRPAKGTKAEGWVSRVAIERRSYLQIRNQFLNIASRRSVQSLLCESQRLTFEPYAPVREQLLQLVNHINYKRKTVCISADEFLDYRQTVRLKRKQLIVFSNDRSLVA